MATQEMADLMLLKYIPTTQPAPLQIDPAHGKIIITIPVPDQTVYCNQIVLGVPYGTDQDALTINPLDTSNFSVSPSSKWQIGQGQATDYDLGGDLSAFVFSTIGTDFDHINYPITIAIDNFVVNNVTGVFTIQIIETSGTDGVNYTKKQGFIKLNKAPYEQFFVNNFRATKNDGSGIVVAEGDYDTSVILNWEGSDNQYYIIYNQHPPINLHGNTSWESPNLKEDTVFILHATQQSSLRQKQDHLVGDPQTLDIYQSIIVKVKTPDVSLNTLQVNQTIVAKGTITGVGMVPPGGIVMYSGDIANFDANGTGKVGTPYQGWQICNTYNNTPDLRDKFIVGAGSSYKTGDQGGAVSVTLNTAQIPQHNHSGYTGGSAPYLNYQGVYYKSKGVSKGLMYNNGVDDPNGNRPNLLTTRGFPEIQVQNHGHSIATDGGGQAHENRPPYYALAFIMRLT